MLCNIREQFPGDEERGSSDNSYESDETSQQSMECDSVVDVTEDDSNEQYVEQDQSEEHEDKNTSNTGKYLCMTVLSVS